MLSDLSRYPTLAVLLTANPDRAHALLGPIELALQGETDLRIRQATIWAKALGMIVEELLPQVPEIPASFLAGSRQTALGVLDLLTLVPFGMGNVQATKAVGLKHAEWGYTDTTLVPVNERYQFQKGWRWILAHDGTPNLGRKPVDCLAQCTGELYAGIDVVGTAIWLVHGARKHAMDLPASVHAGDRGCCACVSPFDGGPRLDANRDAGIAVPKYGTVVFVWE